MHRMWIKLWRKVVDTKYWNEMPYSTGKLWLWLLIEATHKGNTEVRRLNPGQVAHSRSFIRDAMEWYDRAHRKAKKPSPNTIEEDLKRLVDDGMITMESHTRVDCTITICNWETYNSEDSSASSSEDSRGNSSTNSTGSREHKNVENEKHVKNTHRVSIIPKSDVIEGVPIPEGVDDNEVRELTDNYFKSKMNGATPSKPDYGAVRTLLGLGWPRGKIERLFKILPGYAQYHWDRPAAIMGCKRNSSLRIYEILEPHIPSEDDDLPF